MNLTGGGSDRANVQYWWTSLTTALPNGPAANANATYSYDTLGRLTNVSENNSTGTWGYTYDQMGNRLTQTRSGSLVGVAGTLSYTYNTASQLTSSTYGTSTYDLDGNETAAAGMPAGGVPARSAITTSQGGDVTAMTIAGNAITFGYASTNPGLTNQLMTAGTTSYSRSVLGAALSVANVGGTALRYITHPSGAPLGYTTSTVGDAWFLTDRLGSVIALANSSGAIIGRYSYDPYGLNRSTTQNTGTAAVYNQHRFHGGLYNPTTGLTRYGVRWYDPSIGRFTQTDPSGREANPYLYVSANPCNRVDPTGESDQEAMAIATGIVIVATVALFLWNPAVGTAAAAVKGSLTLDLLVFSSMLGIITLMDYHNSHP